MMKINNVLITSLRDQNGRKVSKIYWPGEGEPMAESSPMLRDQLIYMVEDCGDRNEHWIVRFKNGKEVIRYNVKCLDSIRWQKEDNDNE